MRLMFFCRFSRYWRLWASAGLAIVLSGIQLPRAQQRFTSTTALLTLDVSVLDKDGVPVPNLRPEDFVVTVDGETEPVRTMVFLATTAASPNIPLKRDPKTPLPIETGAVSHESEPDPRLFVVMIDDLSIAPTESKGLLVAAERFISRVPSRDWVGLTTTSGTTTVNPSLDRSIVLAKLKRSFGQMNDPRREGQVFVGFSEAQLIDQGAEVLLKNLIVARCRIPDSIVNSKSVEQLVAEYQCAHDLDRRVRDNARFARTNTRNQLDAYISVIKAMAFAPGVKQLVVVTGGVAAAPGPPTELIRVAKAAAAAGVQLTMMMEEPDATDISLRNPRDFATDQQQIMQQVETLAEISGGQFYRVIGQGDRFFDRVLTSAAAVYRIGVDLPAKVPATGQYNIKVATNRPGVRVLASRYASPPPKPLELTAEQQVQRAVKNGELLYAVPIEMNADVVKIDGGSKSAIRVLIDVPASTPSPVAGVFGIVGSDGQLRSGGRNFTRARESDPYHSEFLVPVTAGIYDLRLAIRDGTGSVGAVAQRVVVK